MSTHWATGSPRSKVRTPVPEPLVDEPVPDHPPAPQAPMKRRGESGEGGGGGTGGEDRTPAALAEQASAIAAEWAPTAGRILLGVVFFWFGYHELVQPGGWTQYIPVVSESSSLAIILVLAHGWVLFVLASALVFGVAPRVAAAVASLAMLEIVISLAVTGVDATAMRDVGVLALAVCLTGCKNQRLVLRG
jgi:uncharacterized membrane protein YphA (DoxX/SURF4 family)